MTRGGKLAVGECMQMLGGHARSGRGLDVGAAALVRELRGGTIGGGEWNDLPPDASVGASGAMNMAAEIKDMPADHVNMLPEVM